MKEPYLKYELKLVAETDMILWQGAGAAHNFKRMDPCVTGMKLSDNKQSPVRVRDNKVTDVCTTDQSCYEWRI